MMLAAVKGCLDMHGARLRLHREIEQLARRIASRYDYEHAAPPILESHHLVNRLGEDSDVVTKELFTFMDKSNRSIVLRPEGTAGVARLVASEKILMPARFYYHGPMFRYENPQRGRLRQFDQFGVECFGIQGPTADLEVISMAWLLIKSLHLTKDVQLFINTIGDKESRSSYRKVLQNYFISKKDELSGESIARLNRGSVMRILDSKEPRDHEIIRNAPPMFSHLSQQSADHFEAVKEGLADLNIPFQYAPHLVRGLDYYSHTVFEFIHKGQAILAGGRYDGLIESVTGQKNQNPIGCVGWALGTYRLASVVLETQQRILRSSPVIAFVVSHEKEALASRIIYKLRESGLRIMHCVGEGVSEKKQLSKLLKRANRVNNQMKSDEEATLQHVVGPERDVKAVVYLQPDSNDHIIMRRLNDGREASVNFNDVGRIREFCVVENQ